MIIKTLINQSAIQAIAVLLIAAGNLYAADYYVSASGNDASTGLSASTPWRTLAKVNAARFAAGDRIFFQRGGAYTGGLVVGASGITVDAYGSGPAPIIMGKDYCMVLNGSGITVQNVHIVGRAVDATNGCFWNGIRILGSSNVVRLSEISGTGAGIDIWGNNNHITQNNIHDNNLETVNKCTVDDAGAMSVLIRGDNNELDHNQVSGAWAIDCYDNQPDGSAFEVWQGSNNFIHHNVTWGNVAFAELGTCCGKIPDGNTFAYNTVLGTRTFLMTRGAADYFGPVTHTNMYNNSSVTTLSGVYCYGGCSPANVTLRNNIITMTGGSVYMAMYSDGPLDEDYNVFYGGSVSNPLGAHSLYADPGFKNPAGGDLTLGGSSWATDHGVALGYPTDLAGTTVPQGVGVDMGAYEVVAAASTPSSPSSVGTWTLSLSQIGTGMGMTTGSGVYSNGTVVTLLATPAPGSTFDGWSGGGMCASGAVTMMADLGCIAVFTLVPPPIPLPVVTVPSVPEPVVTVSSTPPPPSPSTPGTLSGVTLSRQTLWVGKTGTLTVSLSAPAAAAFPVALSSSAPDVAGVPATVTVPVGQTSASAEVTAWTVGTATITASAGGASVQATMQVCVRHGNRCR